jgi:hypothetical protein
VKHESRRREVPSRTEQAADTELRLGEDRLIAQRARFLETDLTDLQPVVELRRDLERFGCADRAAEGSEP